MNLKLLETVENDIARLDLNHLTRARLLLQSDYWTADSRLDGRKHLVPDRIAALEAERERIKSAIDRIGLRIEEMDMREETRRGR